MLAAALIYRATVPNWRRLRHRPLPHCALLFAVSRGKQLGMTAHYLPSGILVTVFK